MSAFELFFKRPSNLYNTDYWIKIGESPHYSNQDNDYDDVRIYLNKKDGAVFAEYRSGILPKKVIMEMIKMLEFMERSEHNFKMKNFKMVEEILVGEKT